MVILFRPMEAEAPIVYSIHVYEVSVYFPLHTVEWDVSTSREHKS